MIYDKNEAIHQSQSWKENKNRKSNPDKTYTQVQNWSTSSARMQKIIWSIFNQVLRRHFSNPDKTYTNMHS